MAIAGHASRRMFERVQSLADGNEAKRDGSAHREYQIAGYDTNHDTKLTSGTTRPVSLVEGFGGPGRDRTDDLFHAMEARSQLRHRPTPKKQSRDVLIFAQRLGLVNRNRRHEGLSGFYEIWGNALS